MREQAHPCPSRQVWKSILSDEPKLEGSVWKGISGDAIDFIRSLLRKDPAARLTAKQALKHPWLSGGDVTQRGRGKRMSATVVQKLQRFGLGNTLKRSVLDMITNELLTKHARDLAGVEASESDEHQSSGEEMSVDGDARRGSSGGGGGGDDTGPGAGTDADAMDEAEDAVPELLMDRAWHGLPAAPARTATPSHGTPPHAGSGVAGSGYAAHGGAAADGSGGLKRRPSVAEQLCDPATRGVLARELLMGLASSSDALGRRATVHAGVLPGLGVGVAARYVR